MIISKAIELQQAQINDFSCPWSPDLKDSIKLGIEALKRIEYVRQHPWSEIYAPLPGETMPERRIG